MPLPTTNVRTRPDLAPAMWEYPLPMAATPIATELFTPVEVDECDGTQGVLPAKEILTPTGGPRTGTGGYLRNELQFEDQSWACVENGGEGVIDLRKKSKYKKYFDHEVVVAAVERLKAIQRREIRCAAIVNNTGNYSGRTTGAGTVWTAHSTAVPIDNVETAVQAVYGRTGIKPNTLMLSWKRFRDLRRCDQVIEAITSAGAGQAAKASDITLELLARVFDIEKVVVGDMPYNAANIGQTGSISSIWSDTSALVAYIDRSGNVSMPTHLRMYHWGEDGSTFDGLVEDYMDDSQRKHIIRVRQDTHEKMVIEELGQLITGVAA